MNYNLYYCKHWQYKEVKLKDQEYSICISPKIDGNNQGTTIQYHGIILKEKKVLRIGMLKNDISEEQANLLLEELEEKLRLIIRSNVTWAANAFESHVVKIWYYEEDDQSFNTIDNDKREYPPLRFSITVTNINPLDDTTSDKIKNSLEKVLTEWLNNK